jgi:hypothetical protein
MTIRLPRPRKQHQQIIVPSVPPQQIKVIDVPGELPMELIVTNIDILIDPLI